jgi:probable rRNA maturation factor
MIKINVITNYVDWFRLIKNPNSYIDRKVKKLNIKKKRFKKNIFFCTLLLSKNQEIKKLNKKFRKKNKSTDVLSFPFYEEKNLKDKMKKDKEIYLGDIIINLNKISNKKI